MPEQLKKLFFTTESITQMADNILHFYPGFDKNAFIGLVFNEGWESMELKEKMRHTTHCLHKTLPQSYPQAIGILKKIAPDVKGFDSMTLPDFVEVYGLEDWEISLPALGHFTRFSSSEFAIRPFLDRDPQKTMAQMASWAQDENHMVRRLASEGCRPRLPWAMALPKFKKDPSLILPILEKLKNDPSETVRRSVANNLNDISKDNPETMLDLCEKWHGENENTDAVIKHACRTLMKAGNKRALLLFGFGDPSALEIEHLAVDNPSPAIGDAVYFSFDLAVPAGAVCKVRLEYAVTFMKAKGKKSRKVFQVIEKEYAPGTYSLKRKHSFHDMSTRKHYPGEHGIGIIVNGEEKTVISLELKAG